VFFRLRRGFGATSCGSIRVHLRHPWLKKFLRGFHRYDTSSGCATFSPFGAEKGICAIRVARFFQNFSLLLAIYRS
jgi:hypothetical protein